MIYLVLRGKFDDHLTKYIKSKGKSFNCSKYYITGFEFLWTWFGGSHKNDIKIKIKIRYIQFSFGLDNLISIVSNNTFIHLGHESYK